MTYDVRRAIEMEVSGSARRSDELESGFSFLHTLFFCSLLLAVLFSVVHLYNNYVIRHQAYT